MYQSSNQFDAKLNDEFSKIEGAFNLPAESLALNPRAVVTLKPRTGTMAYADGTHWNPGQGAGLYVYNGSVWVASFGASGAYTPTLFNTTNLAASTAYVCQYLRVGNTVTVSGKVDVDPTAAGSTVLGISLPVASNLSAAEQCSGTAAAIAIAGQCAAILGDAANNRALMQWIAVDTTNQAMHFSFTYLVI